MFKGIVEVWDKYDGIFAVLAVIGFIVGFLGVAVPPADQGSGKNYCQQLKLGVDKPPRMCYTNSRKRE